jgi:hypothetical protein
MKCAFVFALGIAACSLPLQLLSQTNSPPPNCPITFLKLNPDEVSTRVRNNSGKTIIGLTFYAALADATEHWKWVHYDLDNSRPLREFGWNRPIKPGASKSMSWDRTNLDFDHGGGGALVLTSVLYGDGTSWEELPDGATCKAVWYNSHKKSFARPIDLPRRP